MKKNFKIAVISLSFLIIGGILVACGNKKTEEKTTEIITTEANNEIHKADISGYTFEIPSELIFSGSDSNTVDFMKNDNLLTIGVNDYVEDYNSFNETFFKSLSEEMWGKTVKTIDFEYYEKGNFKGCYSWSKIKNDKKDTNIFNCTCIDRSNYVSMLYVLEENNEDKLNEESEFFKKFMNNFIELNY